MNNQYRIDLDQEEIGALRQMVAKGKPGARKVRRANILLMANERQHTDDEIAVALSAGRSTVFRTRKRFVEEGLANALNERSRPGGLRKLDASQEAFLVATACSEPPQGRSRWTLQLLADAVVAGTEVEAISADTVGRRLKDNKLKPWQRKMWCIPSVDATFVARMEDVLELYAEAHDPRKPVVCIDEVLKQLVADTRPPISPKPGKPLRYDYEYKRGGTANIFMMIDRHRGWRHAKVTNRRCNQDYALLMRDLVDVHYPDADIIRVVQDNLNTHKPESLYVTFPAEEARRILRRLEFHYTPKHASWLNMVEIEIGVLSQQCLDRRIGNIEELISEVEAWESKRNDSEATINWLFDVDAARRKLGHSYPKFSLEPPVRTKKKATSPRCTKSDAAIVTDTATTSKEQATRSVVASPETGASRRLGLPTSARRAFSAAKSLARMAFIQPRANVSEPLR